jgi:hypothetical protein
MKKKLALLLAGVMVAAVVPVTAMAGTSTYANKVVTLQKGNFTNASSELVIKDGNGDLADVGSAEFTLELDGAEWGIEGSTLSGQALYNQIEQDVINKEAGVQEFRIVDSTKATVTIVSKSTDEFTRIPLFTKITAKGDVTVTVDGKSSVVSSATCTYAVGISGSARAKIGGTVKIPEDGVAIKNITISETAKGALEKGEIKLKLSKGFKFDTKGELITVIGDDTVLGGHYINPDNNKEIIIPVSGVTNKALEFVLKNIKVMPDGAKVGAVAEITISGAEIDTTTLEAGTYTDYGVKVAIYGDDEVPTFYSGKVYTKSKEVTLPIQISENVADSINANRKLTFTFPEGVKVVTGIAREAEGVDKTGVYFKDKNDSDAWGNVENSGTNAPTFTIKNNVVTVRNIHIKDATKTAKLTFAFNLAISPEFTGDVDVVVGGAAIDVEETLTVANVTPGYTVEADVNEVAIDYRNVAVSDIVIKEAKPGVFGAGEKLYLKVENMQFEKGMDYEVTEGDLELKSVEVNGGLITIEFKEESAKTAGEITLSGVQLYLDRALPAGDYDLISLIGWTDNDVYYRYDALKDKITRGTSFSEATNIEGNHNGDVYFDIDDVTLVKGYIKVVTAGRDVDDSTFTTKIVVPVGEKVIKAGEKDIAIDVPAFINADGYTMMPLRAVVQALSGTAIVTWDNSTKTATVLFGARVISMTIGEKHMVINGVNVAMLAAPVIVDSRTFLPLRDLGYALGLNESQVNWNSETKTATLN